MLNKHSWGGCRQHLAVHRDYSWLYTQVSLLLRPQNCSAKGRARVSHMQPNVPYPLYYPKSIEYKVRLPESLTLPFPDSMYMYLK